jgi:hypothetical protein
VKFDCAPKLDVDANNLGVPALVLGCDRANGVWTLLGFFSWRPEETEFTLTTDAGPYNATNVSICLRRRGGSRGSCF